MKQIFLAVILVLFIVSCSSNNSDEQITGNVVKEIEEEPIEQQVETGPTTCEDSDRGIDKEDDGKVSGLLNGKVYNYVDRCVGPFLIEYYCEDNKPMNKNIKCNCLAGECV